MLELSEVAREIDRGVGGVGGVGVGGKRFLIVLIEFCNKGEVQTIISTTIII